MFESCKEYGLPKPELIDFDGDFRGNMYRRAETNTEIVVATNTNTETNIEIAAGIYGTNTEKADKIVEIMREQSGVTVKKIAEQFGLSISGVRYHVNEERRNSGAYWFI